MTVSSDRKRLILFRTGFYIYILVIIVISATSLEGSALPSGDKLNHALAFIVFALMINKAYPKIEYAKIFVWGIGFGLLIELIQAFVPCRSTEMEDVLADAVGLLAGMSVLYIHTLVLNKRKKEKNAQPETEYP